MFKPGWKVQSRGKQHILNSSSFNYIDYKQAPAYLLPQDLYSSLRFSSKLLHICPNIQLPMICVTTGVNNYKDLLWKGRWKGEVKRVRLQPQFVINFLGKSLNPFRPPLYHFRELEKVISKLPSSSSP